MTDLDVVIEELRKRYESGDKSAVPLCLEYCMWSQQPIPPWLATAFGEACRKVHMREVKSWDDVFGRPLAKGKRLETERRDAKIARPLFLMIQDRRKAGAAINKELFHKVGKEFGVSGTVASEIYYGVRGRDRLRRLPERLQKNRK
jgi:hypothetical protein